MKRDVRKPGKCVMVTHHDSDFGLLRMFEATSGDLPISVGTFRTMEEALQWFGGD
jgi:hypothetical protein